MSLYDQDFFAWTQEQATLLRDKRYGALDVENLAEEVESLGKRDKRELMSRMRVLLTHLLKQHTHPQPEKSWQATIREQRYQLEALLQDSPSLRPFLHESWDDLYQKARTTAAAETELPLEHFPGTCPWSIEEVLQKNEG